MKAGFTIVERQVGPVRVLRLGGNLDGHTHIDLERRLDELLRGGAARIVLDLEQLAYIASAGVGLFISFQHKVKASGGSLQLARPSAMVKEVFGILGLTSLFTVHEAIDPAIAAAGAGAPPAAPAKKP